METRVKDLETRTSSLENRMGIVENDMEHGERAFQRIETDVSTMLKAIYRIGVGIVLALGSGLVGTVVYIFVTAH